MYGGLGVVDGGAPGKEREVGPLPKDLSGGEREGIIICWHLLDYIARLISRDEERLRNNFGPAERYKILGSMKSTGLGSRIALSRRPLA